MERNDNNNEKIRRAMKQVIFLMVLFCMLPGEVLYSQETDIEARIKGQLNQQALKSLAKYDKFMARAEEEMSLASKYETSRKKKYMLHQVKAARHLGKANQIRYKIYRKDLEKFSGVQTADSKTITKKSTRAKRLMKQAKRKREDALKISNNESAYSLLKHAGEIEEKVFKELTDIYKLVIGEAPALNNDQDKKPVLADKYDNTGLVSNITDNPIKNTNSENEVIETEEEEKIADKGITGHRDYLIENNKNIVDNDKTGNETSNDMQTNSGVYFKIQVAASKTELSKEQLTRNFNIKEIIDVDREGTWFKYLIRKSFTDLNKVSEYRKNLGIKGTFIIAFRDGKRISIEEAIGPKEPVVSYNEELKGQAPNNQMNENGGKIVYRLQIGLSFTRLSPMEVAQFNNGGKDVYAIDCGSYFIYAIGDFETENAALNFKRLKGLTDADLVSFRNGKLIE